MTLKFIRQANDEKGTLDGRQPISYNQFLFLHNLDNVICEIQYEELTKQAFPLQSMPSLMNKFVVFVSFRLTKFATIALNK